jgi:CIC family chloride channel protein
LKAARSPGRALAALLAAVTADGLCRGMLGPRPTFGLIAAASPPLATLPVFLAAGVAAGALGALFNRSLLGALSVARRVQGNGIRRPVFAALAVGAAVGLVGWRAPELLGSGEPLVERALHAEPLLVTIVLVLAVRYALTIASYASGAAGGLFAPLLVLGCEAGLLVFLAAEALLPAAHLEPGALAIVAMGAIFAGSVGAPATGVLLMIEMTGAFELLLPLVYAAVVATVVARALGARPIYESLLARDLAGPDR